MNYTDAKAKVKGKGLKSLNSLTVRLFYKQSK